MGSPFGIPGLRREERVQPERLLLRGRRNHPLPRGGLRRPPGHARGAGQDEGAGRRGDVRRRPRHRLRPHLPARQLRVDGGADRAVPRGGVAPRQVHLAPPQRGGRPAGGDRRVGAHLRGGGPPRRDLPPQSGRSPKLAPHGQGHRRDRGGARPRPADQRRHLHLHRRRHRPGQLHPAPVPRRWAAQALRATRRSRGAARDPPHHRGGPRRVGEPLRGVGGRRRRPHPGRASGREPALPGADAGAGGRHDAL